MVDSVNVTVNSDILKKKIGTLNIDLRFALNEIGRSVLKENIKSFILKGGGKFAPLSARYKVAKEKKYPGSPILVVNGTLRDSVTRRGARGSVFNLRSDSIEVGSSLPYARFIQDGTKNMPARPYLFVTEQQEDNFLRIIESEIDRQIRKVNGV